MKVPVQTRAFAIYVFGPCPEGKFYVGQTENVTRRFGSHLKAQGECPEFHKAVKLHGFDSFPVQIVAETDVAEEADRLESLFITKFNSLIPHGYNLTIGGRGVRFQPGAKVVGFTEHPVSVDEMRFMAQRMADGADSEFPGIECPCCGGWNDGSFASCDCGVAPEFSRWLLRWMSKGGELANLPLCDDAKFAKEWRKSQDADFFLRCEIRGVKGRTIAIVTPVAMQKYATRFWPYLESAVRRRCLVMKKLPCYHLGKFRPLPGGKIVEMKRLQIERLLRRNRRELSPGDANIEVFARILGWQKEDSGKLYDTVISTFLEHGGNETEIAEARRRIQFYREVENALPNFLFLTSDLAYVSFDGEDLLAYIRFASRPAIEDAVRTIMAVPSGDRRAALLKLLESPPLGVEVTRMTSTELHARLTAANGEDEVTNPTA